MRALWFLLFLLLPAVACAQGLQRIPTCGAATPPVGNSPGYQDANGNLCAGNSVLTYQGVLAVTSSSVALSTLTLNNSTTFPSPIGKITVINEGANTVYICWTGGTCAATGGSEPIASGASDTAYLGAQTTSPTAFSTSGATIVIHN